ncbi:MAG TPA: carboxypeptidase-like regulatory domain-containing protein [Terracidiphilus sp.]
MALKQALLSGVALAGIAGFLALTPAQLNAQSNTVTIDADDIGGVVTGAAGPEAGVWVIAETTDLGTKMAKMVVTDDLGRYVLPDLPKAHYKVWVRAMDSSIRPRSTASPASNSI